MSHFAHQLYEVAVLVDGEDIFDGMMTKVDRDYGVVGLNITRKTLSPLPLAWVSSWQQAPLNQFYVGKTQVGLNQFYHIQILYSTNVKWPKNPMVTAPPVAALPAPVLTGKLARLEQRERDKSPFAAAVPQRKEPRFTVIKHWGRIGEDDEQGYDSDDYGYGGGYQSQSWQRKKGWVGETTQQFHTLEEARKEFLTVFEEKTKHSWDSRYEKRDYATTRYNFVMTSYSLKIDQAERDADAARSVLPPAVKTFMRTISDADVLRRGMAESGVDEVRQDCKENKMTWSKFQETDLNTAVQSLLPLGKLSLPQIKEACAF